nr:PREDICTED: uncharacterized protein LOC109042095 [Bemisia tabaci]
MASLRLIIALLALACGALVDGIPCKLNKKAPLGVCGRAVAAVDVNVNVKTCPDEMIRVYFDEVRVTVTDDYKWIQANMKAIAAQKAAAEYAALVELLAQLEAAKRTFDTDYNVIQTEVYERVTGFQSKYGLLSISYTERVVVVRKSVRMRLYPDLRNFRAIYIKMLPLFNDFYTKYNLERLIRARALPRACEYNFANYLPYSIYVADINVLTSTPWKDYQYVRDLLNKLDFPVGSPEYELKMRLMDQLIDNWIEFNNNRRELEMIYYPKFVDAGDNQKLIDDLYLDYLAKLRGYTYKYGNGFFEVYGQVEDLYLKRKLPFVAYVDFDGISAETDIRSLYLPSTKLSKYYTKIIVTSRMDYLTAKRLWDNLKLNPDSPEWQLRNSVLPELKQRLDNLEILLNRNIRDSFRRMYELYGKNPGCDFDKEYDAIVIEITTTTDKNILPILYEFREYYYINDDKLSELFDKRGWKDVTRNIIACDSWGYDATVLMADEDLRGLFKWSEKLLKKNYYVPLNDLIQLSFPENSEEWKLRRDALKRLEKVWLEYRQINNYAIRNYIRLVRKNKFVMGSPEWDREIKKIREYCRPKMVVIIEKFKKDCFEINGYLDTLYAKQVGTTYSRSYVYQETTFEMTTITTTRSTTVTSSGTCCPC